MVFRYWWGWENLHPFICENKVNF